MFKSIVSALFSFHNFEIFNSIEINRCPEHAGWLHTHIACIFIFFHSSFERSLENVVMTATERRISDKKVSLTRKHINTCREN